MSFDINYDIPTIITKRNVDSMENPIGVKLLEKKQVMDNHSCIVLSQIPDENYRITIEGFNEVFNSDELGNNNFYVSYSQGVIYFLPRYNGKTVVVEYYGIGYELISASRVFYKYDKHGGIIETLEEILDNAKEQLELIKTLGDSVKVIEKLEMDLENGKVLHDNLENDIEVGTPLQENLHSDIVEAKKWKDQLHQDVADGKVLQPLLQQTVDDAEDVKVRLDKSIADAREDIATIEATGNKEVIIKSSDWRLNGDVYEKEITHPCNSENLHVTAKNSNTKEAVTIGYKILDKTRILLKSDEAINMSVILSASYYHATQTISDNIAEEVVKARKGETGLDVKITKIDEQLDTIEIKKATNTRVDELERQIGQGVTDGQLEEAVKNKIDDGSISSLAVGNNSVKKDNIKINAVTYDKTDFITTGKNLFNKNKITDNSYLNPANGGIGSSNLTCITDYIKCEPSTQYSKNDKTPNYIGAVCFYDENRNFISGIENATTFTTPSNCYYFRTTIWKTVHPISSYQIEKGSSTTTYESYYNTFGIPKVEKIKEKYCVIYGGSILIDVHSGVVTTSNVSVLINREISSTSWGVANLDLGSLEINISSYISQSHFLFNICLIKNGNNYTINVLPYSTEITGNDYIIATFNYLNNEIISLSKDFIKFKNNESTTEETLTLVVKKDGTGDYDNLRKCFDYIESVIDKYKSFLVELYEGTYRVNDYYTIDEWNNVGISVGHPAYYGLTVPNKTHVLGVGNVDNIVITGDSPTNVTIKSTLNFKDTSSVENITVKAKNLRYAVHDDMAWQGGRYERHCKNCKFIGENLTYRQAYGSGTYGNAYWKFDNCLFEVDNEYPPFANHNTSNMEYSSNIEFENCTFKSKSEQDILLNSFTPKALTYVTLKGCNLKGIKLAELEGNSGIAFRVKGYGNTPLNNVIQNTDGKSYTIDIIS